MDIKVPVHPTKLTEYFCAGCGVRDVWEDPSDIGDYYEGQTYYCRSCGKEFTLPSGVNDVANFYEVIWEAR